MVVGGGILGICDLLLNTGVVDGEVGRADEEEVSLYIENLDINRHREIVIMQHRGRSKRLSRTEVYKLRCRIGGSITRMHGVSAHTGFLPRTLSMTNYLSALLSTLNLILSVNNLSRLECVETSRIYQSVSP